MLPIRINQGSPPHLLLRALGVLVIAWFALSPIVRDLKPNEYGQLADIAVLALAALSLNLLIGYTGQISIGHSAFFGLGAYTTAYLINVHGWTGGWTFPVAAVLCFVFGAVVGIPALRLKGLYLALVTLALAQIFPAVLRLERFDWLTGGSQGIDGVGYDPPSWIGLSDSRADRTKWLYILALFLLAVGYVLTRNLIKSRVGRSMVAVRDNTTAAAVMGVNVAVTKTVVFGLSAALAGLAGSMSVLRATQANPDNPNFTIVGSIIFLVIMVVGGTASLLGPIVGAVVYFRFDEFTRALPEKTWLPGFIRDFIEGRLNLATVVFATLLILLMFVAPFGIVGLAKRVARRFVLVIPRPPVLAGAGEAAAPVAEAKVTAHDLDVADEGPFMSDAETGATLTKGDT
jgi:branched-chain amino acid transport system permease protein